MDLLTFVEGAGSAETRHGLFTLLLNAVRPRGLDYVAYGTLTYDPPVRDAGILSPGVMLNYPEDWKNHYFAKAYDKIDPVVLYSPSMDCVYRWDALASRFSFSPSQVRLFGEARDAGLTAGVSVPIPGPHGQAAVVSFASRTPGAPLAADLRELTLLATQFHMSYCRLAYRESPELIHLSARQKECLRWTAVGKSSWDIGVILAISENTVNFHLKNVMKKLGTSSRMVAVLKAIELGLISVSSF